MHKQNRLPHLTDLVTILELLHHNTKSALRDIVTRIHAWVSRSYYWHKMIAVTVILSWIPDRNPKLILFYCTKHDWIRPTPLCIHSKESRNQHTRNSIWIKLAQACNQKRPVYATKKSSNLLKIIEIDVKSLNIFCQQM